MMYRRLLEALAARRSLGAVLVVFLASAMLAGCGGGDDSKEAGGDSGIDSSAETGPDMAPAELSAGTPLVEFGSVVVGETSEASLTITNDGEEATTAISVDLSGANAADFGIVSDGCDGAMLDGGDSCTIDMTFSPAPFTGAEDPRSAQLSVSADEGGELTASLGGVALNEANLEFNEDSHDFGSAGAGTNGSTFSFTLSNTGGVASGDVTLTATGDISAFLLDTTDCEGSPLDAGAECDVPVQFSPASPDEFTATITASADPGGSVDATITGEVGGQGRLMISPGSFDFGTLSVGQTGPTESFTVSNPGGGPAGPLTVGEMGDISHFDYDLSACSGATLAPGDTCDGTAAFAPNAEGAFNASLTVTDPNIGSQSVVLGGIGEP